MPDKVKFALVGCGRICSKHADALTTTVPDAELVGVADLLEDKAAETGAKYGVPHFTSYEKMIEDTQPDVVNILTESGNHAKHAIDIATRYNKHLVVEKPMALCLQDADDMINACAKKDLRLFVVKQNRYNLPVMKAREALEAGRFGKLVLGTVRVRWCRPQHYYDQGAWRGTWAMDGGVFTNQASHHVDLLKWFLGDPISVYAAARTALVDIETEDTGVAVIKFKSGALGVVEATTATRPKDLEGSFSLLGETGSIEIGGFAVNAMKTWQFTHEEEGDKDVLANSREIPPNVYGYGHSRVLQNVCDVLTKDAQSLVDGQEGRKSLELIHAIYESADACTEVQLSSNPEHHRLGAC